MQFSNSIKKYVRSLHQGKYRQKYNKFIAEGPKVCNEFLMCKAYDIEYILALTSWIETNQDILTPYWDKIIPINSKELGQISQLTTANQVIMVMSNTQISDYDKSGWSLFIDCIQDPGNMGTMIRVADWFGISSVYATKDSVDFYNPKVIQSAMGSHNRVELKEYPSSQLAQLNKPIYGLVLEGEDIREYKPAQPGIIAIGNESKGLSLAAQESLDYRCTIKKYGGAESLNAAIACGIACQTLIPK